MNLGFLVAAALLGDGTCANYKVNDDGARDDVGVSRLVET